MREVVIVDSVRTGLAKSFRGKFNLTRPDDMAAHCVYALLARTGIDPALVDDCIVGAGSNEGAQGMNIGRNVAVLSGLGTNVAGMTLNRFCSSGLQAIAIAANQVASGCSDVIVAGGVESITMTLKSMNTQNLFNPVLQKRCAGYLLPHGPDRRDRRPSLQRQPRGAGRLCSPEPAAHRTGSGGRFVRR
jgi:acetyl-CoA acyltransferase